MTNEFKSARVKYRGVIYEIRELSAAKYDKTVKQATTKDEDTGVEKFDGDAHTRILLSQSVRVGGKAVDVEDDLYSKGNALVRALQKKVFALHLDDEPEEDIEDDEGEADSPESA